MIELRSQAEGPPYGYISCPEMLEVSASSYEKVCAERDAYLENLTSVQTRCTELLLENRAMKSLIDRVRQIANTHEAPSWNLEEIVAVLSTDPK